MEKIPTRDFAPGARSIDVIQAQDFTLVRYLIEKYFGTGNEIRTVDFSFPVVEILGSAVVVLADAFESFLDHFPAESAEKLLLENSTGLALGEVKALENFRE